MLITRQLLGHVTAARRGRLMPVHGYRFDSGADLAVEVWSYGATLVEVLVPDTRGRTKNVVARLPELDDYTAATHEARIGATMGRFCRNVAYGRFRLDGVQHELDLNEGAHHVHGGTFGFDRCVWEGAAERDGDVLRLRLGVLSIDGDQGYPGDLEAHVEYAVDQEQQLTITFTARTTASTIVGLTNHAFWNLAGAGRIDDQQLALNTSRFVACDAEQIPLPGPPVPVGHPLSGLARPRRLGSMRLDNFFVLDDPTWAATLADPDSGRAVRLTTDQPGIGVYTGDGLPSPRSGVCLQPGPWPDAPNRPDFPSARLDPGHVYRARTTYRFRVGGR
jgi:aldose 1-epimerase